MKMYIDDLEIKIKESVKKGENEVLKEIEKQTFLCDLEKFLIGTGYSFKRILVDSGSNL